MQSGGGVPTDDTSTLNSVCGYVWCMFGKKNKGADYLPLSSSASSPHTLDLVQNIRVVPDEALGWRREGSFVLSAYWKCTVGFFPAWETIYANLSPLAHIYLIWLAASASSSGSFSLPAAQS